ncbi:uncharacterized protein LOC111136351 [Crassostrea virginica]
MNFDVATVKRSILRQEKKLILKEYFVTDICGQEIGPDFGTYLEFDKDGLLATDGKFAPPSLIGKELKCTITIRGMPSSGEKRYMSVYWRNFIFKAPEVENIEKDPEKCGKAYVTLYEGKGTNVAVKESFCGLSALPSHIEWEGEYVTLFFYVDYRSPAPSDPTDPSKFLYPEVFFRLDVTSFDFECSDTKQGIVMLCNDSKRCLDDSLRCDFWFSRNCQSESYPRDNSDTSRWPPGDCYKIVTTTTVKPPPPPPPPETDFTALFVILALVASFLLFFWCFWRPGYLIWRLGRLRNHPCMRACGACIPCSVMCIRCCSCSTCCIGEYQQSPTGAAAFRAIQRQDMEQRNSMEGRSLIDGISHPIASVKEPGSILSCFPRKGVPGKRDGKRLRQATVCPLQSTTEECMWDNENDGKDIGPHTDIKLGGGKPDPARKEAPGVSECPFSFSIDWVKMLTSDGFHLREHR